MSVTPEGMKYGVKGSTVYETAGDPRLSLYMQLVRGAEEKNIQEGVKEVIAMNTDQAMKDIAVMAFQTRDVRGGKGERKLFYTMLQAMTAYNQELGQELIKLIPEYGSWDDMFTIANGLIPSLKGSVLLKAAAQVEEDEKKMAAGESISLVGKWAPREGKAFTALASEFARLLAGNPNVKHSQIMSAYRRRMVRLNTALKTVETYECANRWDEIDPARVPGRARHIKMAAYMNEKDKKQGVKGLRFPENEKRMACRQHFQEFFEKAAKGEVKITGVDTLYPHELVERASGILDTATNDDKNSINAVWDGMVAKASQGGGLGRSTVMCDFSGSMGGTPYWVSLAMGILISSVTTPAFKNRFMSFDSVPTWHTFRENEKTLFEKLESIRTNYGIGHGTSTDFQKALDLILKTLKDTNCQPGEEPENLIVVTDMGWDEAYNSVEFGCKYVVKTAPWQTHLEMAREAFRVGGWKVPRIVVWNVSASYSTDFQAQADTEGVLMLSGWSPSLFKVLCEEGPKLQNPYDTLRAQLDDKRYDPVRAIMSEWLQGGWRT